LEIKENNMTIIDSAKEWLFGIAIKKAVVSAAKLIVSYAISHGIKVVCSVNGVAIDTTDEAAMVLALNTGLGMLRNFLKVKWPKSFGWL
jgi:hypothetical protein